MMKGLGIDGDDSYIILQMYLMSLNCTLTNSNSTHILQLKFFNVKKIEVGIGVGKINTTEALITWSLRSNGRGRQKHHTRAYVQRDM